MTSSQSRWLRKLLSPIIVGVLLAHWAFAIYVERTFEVTIPPVWWQSVLNSLPDMATFTPGVMVLYSLFALRVLRHFVPIWAGWYVARAGIILLLKELYNLDNQQAAGQFLSRLRAPTGRGGFGLPITREGIVTDTQQNLFVRVGGPGRIIVQTGEVVITEHNAQFHRVLPSGIHDLGAFERIYTVLDLRSYEVKQNDIPLVTKEGIPLSTSLGVTFRLHTKGVPPTRTVPYPFDSEAIRKAAYAKTVFSDRVAVWYDMPLPTAVGQLQKVVAGLFLDEVVVPNAENRRNPNSLSQQFSLPVANEEATQAERTDETEEDRRRPHENIQKLVEEGTVGDLGLKAKLETMGIELVSLRLGALELMDSVTEQYIALWQSRWESKRQVRAAAGQARALETVEMAQVEAKKRMIEAIAEGIRQAREEGNAGTSQELMTLRLIEVLENIAQQSPNNSFATPPELLTQLHALRERVKS